MGLNSLVLTNPLGLWALLGLPLVLIIHFLQPRARTLVINTLFLLENMPPAPAGGRAFRWLRSSWVLWLQLFAVLLFAWLLVGPRWLKPDSVQTVVIVLDSTASMRPFKDRALEALAKPMRAISRQTARTEWIVQETRLASPRLYRGADQREALAALSAWQPDAVGHDFTPALNLARRLAGEGGNVILVTDRKPAEVPSATALLCLGSPRENTGFVGGSVNADALGAPQWNLLVLHNGQGEVRRRLHIEQADGQLLATRELTLEPGRLSALSGPFGAESAALRFRLLSAEGQPVADDALDLDNTITLREERLRELSWRLSGASGSEAATFFERVLKQTPGLRSAADGESADLVVALYNEGDEVVEEARLLELRIYTVDTRSELFATEPVIADRHPWVDGLAWSSLLGPGPFIDALPSGASPLLWQGQKPLSWVEGLASGGHRVVFAWDWAARNADRLPAVAVLLHRAVEDIRSRKQGPETRNLLTGQRIQIAESSLQGEADWTLRVDDGATTPLTRGEVAAFRTPVSPGFFVLERAGEPWLTGATQFGDPREGDFAGAEEGFFPVVQPAQVAIAKSEVAPWEPLLILMLLGLMLAGWWLQRERNRAENSITKGAST